MLVLTEVVLMKVVLSRVVLTRVVHSKVIHTKVVHSKFLQYSTSTVQKKIKQKKKINLLLFVPRSGIQDSGSRIRDLG